MFAAVVLAIGLLALAGMQGISLGKNVDANELTLATNLAADMVERIQFNRRNAIVYQSIDTLGLLRPIRYPILWRAVITLNGRPC